MPRTDDDIVRKADLVAFGTELRAELRLELSQMELRLERSIRASIYANLAAMTAFAAVVIAAVKL
jgi:hypothetical protein